MPNSEEECIKYYKIFEELCLELDSIEGTVHTKATKEILAEVSLRWKISHEYREISSFSILLDRYIKREIGILFSLISNNRHQWIRTQIHRPSKTYEISAIY